MKILIATFLLSGAIFSGGVSFAKTAPTYKPAPNPSPTPPLCPSGCPYSEPVDKCVSEAKALGTLREKANVLVAKIDAGFKNMDVLEFRMGELAMAISDLTLVQDTNRSTLAAIRNENQCVMTLSENFSALNLTVQQSTVSPTMPGSYEVRKDPVLSEFVGAWTKEDLKQALMPPNHRNHHADCDIYRKKRIPVVEYPKYFTAPTETLGAFSIPVQSDVPGTVEQREHCKVRAQHAATLEGLIASQDQLMSDLQSQLDAMNAEFTALENTVIADQDKLTSVLDSELPPAENAYSKCEKDTFPPMTQGCPCDGS